MELTREQEARADALATRYAAAVVTDLGEDGAVLVRGGRPYGPEGAEALLAEVGEVIYPDGRVIAVCGRHPDRKPSARIGGVPVCDQCYEDALEHSGL